MREKINKILFFNLLTLGLLCFVVTGFAQQITLTFWKFSDTNDDSIVKKYVDLWNELNPDTQVNFVTLPWEDYTGLSLPAAFAANAGPDIFWLSPGDLLRYVNEDMLLPLDGYVSEEELRDLLPAARQRSTIEGVLYGLPIEMEPVGIFYNVDLFNEHGIGQPRNFEELMSTAEKLTTENQYGLIIDPVPSYYQVFTWYPFLWGAGADIVSSDWKKATLDSEGAIAALEFWGDLIKKGCSPSTLPVPETNVDPLISKLGAMQVIGMWAIYTLRHTPPDFEVNVFPVPPLQENMSPVSVFGGWSFVINSKTSHPKEAVEFAKWIIFDSDFLKEFCVDRVSKLPSRVSTLEAGQDIFRENPLAQKIIEEILPISRPEPRYPTDIVKAVMDALSFVMFADLPAKDAARLASFQIQSFLDTYAGHVGAYTYEGF